MDGIEKVETVAIRFRASWSSLLSGTVLILALALLLTGLGWGITLIAIGPNQFFGGFIAAFIIGIASTLVAAAVGGFVAGWLKPGSRVLGALHGLLACGLAFLIASVFWMRFTGATVSAAGGTMAQAAQTAAATSQVVSARGGNVASGAVNFLTSLGYPESEARAMVQSEQQSIQRVLRRGHPGAEATVYSALESVMTFTGAAMWIYMGTWLLSMLVALGFGALGSVRAGEPVLEREVVPGYTPPLRPREV